MNKSTIILTKENGKLKVEGRVMLDDTLSSLDDGIFVVQIFPKNTPADEGYYQRRFFAGLRQLKLETGNEKKVLYEAALAYGYEKMLPEKLAKEWFQEDLIDPGADLTVKYLTEAGWPVFYQHTQRWAFDTFGSYI